MNYYNGMYPKSNNNINKSCKSWTLLEWHHLILSSIFPSYSYACLWVYECVY